LSRAEQKASHGGETVEAILKLRVAVGLLGEKDYANWWPSLWFTSNAAAFLTPIYGKRTDVARYHGVVETARRVHDSHIGVGQAFHLFRLPESLERRLHDAAVREDALKAAEAVAEKTTAEALLESIATNTTANTGPIRVGPANELEGGAWIGAVAGHYLKAFKDGHQSFPYFAGT
jgi:hypothetical protein